MKKLKCFIIVALALLAQSLSIKAQPTPSQFQGQNAWMPDSSGRLPGLQKILGGKIHKNGNWSKIKSSNVALVRHGGSTANSYSNTPFQYLQMVDSIRAKGMEPILQVPFRPFSSGTVYDTTEAKSILTYINITKARKVKYWIIGNEPDLKYGYNTKAVEIASYIKRISIAMKKIDSTIKIIGPGLYYMPGDPNDPKRKQLDTLTNSTQTGASWHNNIMGLIPSGNGKASGKAYVDYFSYHSYEFEGYSTTPTKSSLITELTTAKKDTAAMGYIKRRCDLANTTLSRSSQPILPVITEANICYYDSDYVANDKFDGVKANSFFAGQYWAEYMSWGIFKGIQWINWWSAIEGFNSGYLTGSGTTAYKKSTYLHQEQMGKWFKGFHHIATVDSSGSARPTIKAFASVTSSYIAVMVINQDAVGSGYRKYNISFDNTANGANVHVKFNLGMIGSNYTDTSYYSSTNLLIFDCSGALAYKYRYKQTDSASAFKNYTFTGAAPLMTVSVGADATVFSNCCHTYTVTITPTGTYSRAWYANGSPVGGTNATTYTRCNTDGLSKTIKCVVTDLVGCTAQDEALFIASSKASCESPGGGERIANSGTSVTETLYNSSLLSLLPNPTNGKVNVNYNIDSNSKSASLMLLNYSGQLIAQYNLKSEDNNLEIDSHTLPAGLYFTTLIVDGKKVSTKKLVVTK